MQAPVGIDDDVEEAEDEDEEDGRLLGAEADGDHDAGAEAEDGADEAEEGELAVEGDACTPTPSRHTR